MRVGTGQAHLLQLRAGQWQDLAVAKPFSKPDRHWRHGPHLCPTLPARSQSLSAPCPGAILRPPRGADLPGADSCIARDVPASVEQATTCGGDEPFRLWGDAADAGVVRDRLPPTAPGSRWTLQQAENLWSRCWPLPVWLSTRFTPRRTRRQLSLRLSELTGRRRSCAPVWQLWWIPPPGDLISRSVRQGWSCPTPRQPQRRAFTLGWQGETASCGWDGRARPAPGVGAGHLAASAGGSRFPRARSGGTVSCSTKSWSISFSAGRWMAGREPGRRCWPRQRKRAGRQRAADWPLTLGGGGRPNHLLTPGWEQHLWASRSACTRGADGRPLARAFATAPPSRVGRPAGYGVGIAYRAGQAVRGFSWRRRHVRPSGGSAHKRPALAVFARAWAVAHRRVGPLAESRKIQRI